METKEGFITKIKLYFKSELKFELEKSVERLVIEAKDRNRLQDVLHIRQHGDYKPDYNKPKLYTDFKLLNNEGEEISGETLTNCPRPVDFGNDYEKWLNSIHLEHSKTIEQKQLLELQKQQRKDFFQNEVGKFVMGRMMKIN